MQTITEQRQSNRTRITAYYRRHSAWIKERPGATKERLQALSARYRKGLFLRRFWRDWWTGGQVKRLSAVHPRPGTPA